LFSTTKIQKILVNSKKNCNFAENYTAMSTVELRSHIAHRLAGISDINVLVEINAILDFKASDPIFRCTMEQREAIIQAQQAVANGDYVSHDDVQNAVELCLSEN